MFSYERIGANGKLKSYFGISQKWKYSERGRERTIKVEYFYATEYGVQYYFVSIDGKFCEKKMSAARLRYFLNEKHAEEINGGSLSLMPLQIEEVKIYFDQHEGEDCPECGGTGINDDGKICRCARHYGYEIQEFNAALRLKKLLER